METKISNSIPKINGLVLTGGNSTRMGTSKSKMDWHGKEQQYYVADLLSKFCDRVYISCTENQVNSIDKNYSPLPDSFIGLGPMSGILSAFRLDPNVAWLVLACDLPLADEEIISELIAERKPKYMATAFENELDSFPEPLITIWEPKSYRVLLSFLSEGIICPRKVLRNNEINLITPKHSEKLFNTNTPEDAAMAKKILSKNETRYS
ncbi:MAG: molybdenum cofactor guanylyltransferase [Bacteroidetes bacterium]|nr:MAG: molybdenum cofactor guanylyltransferase [Bacteroidota bacterium]